MGLKITSKKILGAPSNDQNLIFRNLLPLLFSCMARRDFRCSSCLSSSAFRLSFSPGTAKKREVYDEFDIFLLDILFFLLHFQRKKLAFVLFCAVKCWAVFWDGVANLVPSMI